MAEEVGFEPTNPFGLSVFKTDAFNQTQPPLHYGSNLTMNRFVLDLDPKLAAEYHCNKHVVKMIVEECQMLSTAHRLLSDDLSSEEDKILYNAVYMNHPCAIWVRQTSGNYEWAYALLENLCQEYTLRYERVHKSSQLLPYLQYLPKGIVKSPLTDFAQAVPEDCKHDNPVIAYQKYYREHKSSFAKWTKRSVPTWFGEGNV